MAKTTVKRSAAARPSTKAPRTIAVTCKEDREGEPDAHGRVELSSFIENAALAVSMICDKENVDILIEIATHLQLSPNFHVIRDSLKLSLDNAFKHKKQDEVDHWTAFEIRMFAAQMFHAGMYARKVQAIVQTDLDDYDAYLDTIREEAARRASLGTARKAVR